MDWCTSADSEALPCCVQSPERRPIHAANLASHWGTVDPYAPWGGAPSVQSTTRYGFCVWRRKNLRRKNQKKFLRRDEVGFNYPRPPARDLRHAPVPRGGTLEGWGRPAIGANHPVGRSASTNICTNAPQMRVASRPRRREAAGLDDADLDADELFLDAVKAVVLAALAEVGSDPEARLRFFRELLAVARAQRASGAPISGS